MRLLVGQAARPEIYLIDPRNKLLWLVGNLIIAIACHGIATLGVLVGMILFISALEKDLLNIKEGQQTRGMELRTIGQKIKGLFSITLPLLLRTLKRTNDVALSMELKRYTLHRRCTFLRTLQWRRIDFICLAAGALYLGLLAAWKV